MKRSIYLAGRTKDVLFLQGVRLVIRESGHVVTSRWLDLDSKLLGRENHAKLDPYEAQHHAERDLRDIRESDAIAVFLPHWENARGGMHFEAGYALAEKIRILAIGDCPNIFYDLPGIGRLKFDDTTTVGKIATGIIAWLDRLPPRMVL